MAAAYRALGVYYYRCKRDYDRALEAFLAVSPDVHPGTWALASPTTHVDQTDPPLLLLHSDSDGVVPYSQSIALAERYREVGVTAQLVKVPKAPHAFWNFQRWFADTMEKALAFFNAELGPSNGN